MKRKLSIILSLAILAVLLMTQVVHAEVVLSDKYDMVSVSGGAYIVNNNVWGATTAQTLSVNESTGAFKVTKSDHYVPHNGAPASYPSIFKGSHWGNDTTNSGMPIMVNNISNANSSWSISSISTGAWDAAYDIWFNKTPSTSGQPDGTEMMIWLNSRGVQPAGHKIGSANIGGATWDVWYENMGWNYVAYVRTSPTNSVNFDLKGFFNDAQSRGYIQGSWYLTAVEAGFELWQGGTGLASNSFSVSINGGGSSNPLPTPTRTPIQATPTPTRTPVQVSATPTKTPAYTPVAPPNGSSSLKVECYNSNKASTTSSIDPKFRITNNSSSSINLSNVTLRYYFTNEGSKSQSLWCDWASVGTSNVTGKFVKMSSPATNADNYLEIGFSSGAGSLNPGSSVEIQTRFAKSDWSSYNQSNDYSFNPTASSYTVSSNVPAYISGSLVSGSQPSGSGSVIVPTVTPYQQPTPTATPIQQPTPTQSSAPVNTPTPPPSNGSTGCSVSYVLQNSWSSGGTVSITIKNNSSSPINGWTLKWMYSGDQKITNLWGGQYSQSGSSVTIKDSGYNAYIPPNGSISFGFNMSFTGTNTNPTSFTLNGTACQVQ